MSRRKTMAELAQAAEVSLSTVDRILSGRGPVKRWTVEHVLATAERIGFHATGVIRGRLTEDAPERVLGFLLNGRDRQLYSQLGEELARATVAAPTMRGRAVVRHLDRIDPEAAADALRTLGKECQAIAAVLIDHPLINLAIADLAKVGVPVFSLMSDVSAPQRAGFLGASDWQLGRTAGWFMRCLRPGGGKVGMLVGSGRYLCQQAHEMGFRHFLTESGAQTDVLRTRFTAENDEIARTQTLQLLDNEPDMVGLMLAGGGLDGVVAALQGHARTDITVIGTELTDVTRLALLHGSVDVILCHPSLALVDRTIAAMEAAIDNPGTAPIHHIVPFQVAVGENV